MPQLLLSAVFITKTGQFQPIIVISFISSLWSLTSRVSSDDKPLFDDDWKSLDFSYKKCPFINFKYIFRVFVRFMEISSRVASLTLMWINIGGVATGIIIGFEFIWLLIICIGMRAIMNMGNLMYLVYDYNPDNAGFADPMWFGFIYYRLASSYIYLILITCFANIRFETWKVDDYDKRNNNTVNSDSIGFYMFIYVWIIYFIWPCCMYVLKEKGARRSDMDDQQSGRHFETFAWNRDYDGICEMIEIGRRLNEEDLTQLRSVVRYHQEFKNYNENKKKMIHDAIEQLEQRYV